ncbi:uncharacterized protein K444DRAFT_631842 [Hyaloscypha bicolor E]|uniref:Heterokaryon incompatibility domain-containing protein n=1 Tax=Hyaloscypha bicolor E TaxID=1095630 RepID=A0A2J6T3S8_9HELO|nr:uncharacterized protein K444DRAFT_631842 [Hyaloscypha bicolor E]PMD57672.1 hypothetical protein K444DRAFT_631842 [Hyaloscypha bicolor E]
MSRYGSYTVETELQVAPEHWYREALSSRGTAGNNQLSVGPVWTLEPPRFNNEAQRILRVRISPDHALTNSSVSLLTVHRPSIYTPLDKLRGQFRVLVLKEGSWDDPIVCKLAIQSLGDNLQNYAALSYTWNDSVDATQDEPEGHHYIKVNHERISKLAPTSYMLCTTSGTQQRLG